MKKNVCILFILLCTISNIIKAQDKNCCDDLHSCDWNGWKVDSIAPGYIWYNYTGYYGPFNSNQTVNVISFNYKQSEYNLEIVHSETPDSVSAFADRYGAIAAINGSYFEPDVSFVKTNGNILREVTATKDHVGFWKHEGALFYDSKKKKMAIAYGNNGSYKSSTYPNILSGAPMLIDDFNQVGETFAAMPDSIDIKKLNYEDYRRHQGVRHPRVAVAITADEKLIFIVVDGRWPSSVGMTAKELTQFLTKYFKPRYALNIDGGGSTTMWIKDRGVIGTHVVNYPVDNKRYDHYGQRAVNNVILLKRK